MDPVVVDGEVYYPVPEYEPGSCRECAFHGRSGECGRDRDIVNCGYKSAVIWKAGLRAAVEHATVNKEK